MNTIREIQNLNKRELENIVYVRSLLLPSYLIMFKLTVPYLAPQKHLGMPITGTPQSLMTGFAESIAENPEQRHSLHLHRRPTLRPLRRRRPDHLLPIRRTDLHQPHARQRVRKKQRVRVPEI